MSTTEPTDTLATSHGMRTTRPHRFRWRFLARLYVFLPAWGLVVWSALRPGFHDFSGGAWHPGPLDLPTWGTLLFQGIVAFGNPFESPQTAGLFAVGWATLLSTAALLLSPAMLLSRPRAGRLRRWAGTAALIAAAFLLLIWLPPLLNHLAGHPDGHHLPGYHTLAAGYTLVALSIGPTPRPQDAVA